MGLNDIKLSSSSLLGLYNQSLVQTNDPRPEKPQAKDSPPALPMPEKKIEDNSRIKFLGDNLKNILIVVDYDEVAFLPDEELEFLTRMLTACKLNLGDVAIINLSKLPHPNYKELIKEFKSQLVFLFGIEPLNFGLPVSFPAYQVQSLAGTTFLYSQALEERHKDDLLKSKLWVCLKKIFAL